MDYSKLLKFVDDGISFYKVYLEVTQKRLDSGINTSDEDFIQLVAAEKYYAGRLDSLDSIKSYIIVFSDEDANAKTDN